MPTEKEQPVICLDKELNDFIAGNTRASWLEYCRHNGIDPNAEELPSNMKINDNGGNDR